MEIQFVHVHVGGIEREGGGGGIHDHLRTFSVANNLKDCWNT